MLNINLFNMTFFYIFLNLITYIHYTLISIFISNNYKFIIMYIKSKILTDKYLQTKSSNSLIIFLLVGLFLFKDELISQNTSSLGNITGQIQFDAQYYREDSLIGAQKIREQILSQGFMALFYTYNNLEVGIRYEVYQNPLLGIDPLFRGQGVPYRYAKYKNDFIEVTAGNFYEQFGSGLIFRSYEERALGIDNVMEGFRAKITPTEGLAITALVGKQRLFWGLGDGIVRAGNLDADLNSLLPDIMGDNNVTIGLSAVSKFEPDLQNLLNLPENVLSLSGRLGFNNENNLFDLEYAYKYNDPNLTNGFNFNPGQAWIMNYSYFDKGIGVAVAMHRLDNMDFRSDRDAALTRVQLGYVPPTTRQHTYRLSSVYPYGTQFNGEFGAIVDLTYKLEKGTALGGEYGTTITAGFSRINNIDTIRTGKYTYNTDLFSIGDRIFYQDLNFNIARKFSDFFKASLDITNQIYDKDILENSGSPKYGKVKTTSFVFDGTFTINDENAIRTEIQHLFAKNDSTLKDIDNINGNWAMFLLEYTVAQHWFLTAWDEYNYGNFFDDRQLHYLNFSVAYVYESTRVSMTAGKQRGGILCVGGVCRPVPASNGFSLNITSTF